MMNLKNILKSALFTASLVAVAAPSVSAELSVGDRFQLKALMEQAAEKKSRGANDITYVQAFIKLKPGQTINDLEGKGIQIINRLDDILIVSMPIEDVIPVSNLKSIAGMQLARKLKPINNKARLIGKLDSVQQGVGTIVDHGFDGTGMFVSLFDTGLDPNNPNFQDRVQIVMDYSNAGYDSTTGDITTAPDIYEGSDIANFTTDDPNETHGTHTLGILTGNAPMIDTCVVVTGTDDNPKLERLVDSANPYYGVAYNASIGVACSNQLLNAFIVDGVDRLIEFGEEQNLPVIVSLSLGDQLGPHDGSDYAAEYLSKLAEKAPIFVAAGNEGDAAQALSKTFTQDETLKTFIVQENSNGATRYSFNASSQLYIEIWGKDGDILDASLAIVNSSGSVQKSYPLKSSQTDINLSTTFPNDFTSGTISFVYEIDSTTGRYNGIIASTSMKQKSTSSNYLAIIINGKTGQRADLFTQTFGTADVVFSSRSKNGWTEPDGNMSVSNMACGKNLIVVGAMNPRAYIPTLSGPVYNGSGIAEVGDVFDYSSFGTLIDGRSLPQFVAPGMMVSSFNHYYTDQLPTTPPANNAFAYTIPTMTGVYQDTDNGNSYYWSWLTGTSMATPFAAGLGALWQQCYMEKNNGATMSGTDILNVVSKNSTRNSFYSSAKNKTQWGTGIINALAGIKYILTGVAGIGKIHLDAPENDHSFVMSLRGKDLNVFVADASALDIKLVSVAGRNIMSRTVNTNDYTQSLDNVAPGIYVLKVITPEGGNYTRKISLK